MDERKERLTTDDRESVISLQVLSSQKVTKAIVYNCKLSISLDKTQYEFFFYLSLSMFECILLFIYFSEITVLILVF